MKAFITGATEGIGYEFAEIFASKGNDLILVARNGEKLDKIARNFKEKYGVDTLYYAKDLSVIDNAKYIAEDLRIRGIVPDYAVNNAGFGTSGEWTAIEWEQECMMINLNVTTLAFFTKEFAIRMKERGSGRILNVGSTASFIPIPYMSAYGATKAFVLSLSNAVAFEMKGTGVSVSVLCPGVTASKFHSRANTENTLQKSKMLIQSSSTDTALYGYKIMNRGKLFGVHRFLNKISMWITTHLMSRTNAMRMASSSTRNR